MYSILKRSSTVVSRAALPSTRLVRWQPPPKTYDPQFGDYPQLPWKSIDQRDPYAYYDDPVHRRNFGETVPEEFDMQDAYFPGEHKPLENFTEGLKGQLSLIGIAAFFVGAAYVALQFDDTKAPQNVLPMSVVRYLQTAGWDEVNNRPYEVPKMPPLSEQVVPEYNPKRGQ